ncbi:MAG TPA: SDR family NAD(P)-dependent oxidoreductase, partial [Ilumatobacteraceae bacterium]|nr:SDR family NAD(P)-dependent oxidoreductase [Ilumatobacteraceae bacterium]
MGQLDGRIALVTGGGRGIGRAISELLASEGAAVGVNYRRDAEAAQATVDAIRSAGGAAIAIQGSVDDADACAAAVETVVSEFGGLDILVCNAG